MYGYKVGKRAGEGMIGLETVFWYSFFGSIGLTLLFSFWLLMNGFSWSKNFGIGMGIGFGILFIIGMIILPSVPTYTHKQSYSDTPIYSLNDQSMISGQFFLGIGSINGQMTYVYYQNVNGGFQLKEVEARDVTIYQDEDNNPFLRVYSEQLINDDTGKVVSSDPISYEFHIPGGSIVREFNLNGGDHASKN